MRKGKELTWFQWSAVPLGLIIRIGVDSHRTCGRPCEVAVRLEAYARTRLGGHRVDEGGYITSQSIVIQIKRCQFTQTHEIGDRSRQARVGKRKVLQVGKRTNADRNL